MVVEIKYPATTKKFQVPNWLVFFFNELQQLNYIVQMCSSHDVLPVFLSVKKDVLVVTTIPRHTTPIFQ